MSNKYTLGIAIGSTTVKIAILDENDTLLFADYQRHFANIQETLAELLTKAYGKLGELTLHPVITGSGGLTLANHLGVPFVQEVIAVSTSLHDHRSSNLSGPLPRQLRPQPPPCRQKRPTLLSLRCKRHTPFQTVQNHSLLHILLHPDNILCPSNC